MKPKTHAELDALVDARLTPILDELADQHGVLLIAVCSVDTSGMSTVIANMGDQDARAALAAALYAYEHGTPLDHTH